MPEPTNNEPTDNKDDTKEAVTSAIDQLVRKMDQNSNQALERFSSLENRLDSMDLDDDDEKDTKSDDDDTPVTKKDLSDFARKVVEESVKKSNEASSKQLERKTKQQEWDVRALTEHPTLQQNHPEFNKKFMEEVGKEIQTMKQDGRTPQDPRLLYDAASVVSNRGRREGWVHDVSDAEKEIDAGNRRSESFHVRKTKPTTTDKPTDTQNALAERMGLSKESLAKHYERTTKIVKDSVDN